MNLSQIETFVQALNYDWFLFKKDVFVDETFYVKSLNRISEGIEYISYITIDGEEIDDSSVIEIDIDFNRYCWSDVYPYCRSQEPSDKKFPVNASYISSNIIRLIEQTLNGVTDIKSSYSVIMSVINTVKNSIHQMLEAKGETDPGYVEALNYFFQQFKKELSSKYGYIKRVHNLAVDYKPTLDFRLNQNQLGALLFILNKADVFNNIIPGDTDFLNFCLEYFTFKHRTTKTQEPPTELRNKFNAAKEEYCPARDEIIRKLLKVVKEYGLKG